MIRLAAVVSLGFFVYLFLRLGPDRIWELLRRMSWRQWLILLAARLVYWMIRAVNWRLVLTHFRAPVSVARLLAARLAGHAVSYLTPSAKLGGEAVRILILNRVDRGIVLASAVVDKTIEFLAMILLLGAAVLIAVLKVSMPGGQRLALVSVTAVAALALVLLLAVQRRGLFTRLLDGLARLRIRFAFLEKRRERLREADARIAEFYRRRRGVFAVIFLLYGGMGMLWAMELRLTFVFLGAPDVSWLNCFLLVMLGSLSYLIPALPASLGIYELTYVSLFALLGIDLEQGLAALLVRRVLGLAWAGLGLIPMLGRRRASLQA